MEVLRTALVGYGVIGPRHIEAFAAQGKRVNMLAVCDTSLEKAEAGCAYFMQQPEASGPAPRPETDYARLLDDPNIDAVIICLPHNLHHDVVVAAAQAGKHILCEKPLAPTLAECDSMIAAAKAANVILMHGENMRTYPVVTEAAKAIAEGKIGRLTGLQHLYAHWQPASMNQGWRANPAEAGGGQLMDAAIHHVDVLRHLGGEMTEVQAFTTQHRPELGPQSEDTGVLNFRFAKGHLGQLFAGHATRNRGASPLITVWGDEGTLSLEPFGTSASLLFFAPRTEPVTLRERAGWHESFLCEAAHFVEAVCDGVPLCSTAEDGRRNVEVILAAYESARTGRSVTLS